jgi:hypothetical protein
VATRGQRPAGRADGAGEHARWRGHGGDHGARWFGTPNPDAEQEFQMRSRGMAGARLVGDDNMAARGVRVVRGLARPKDRFEREMCGRHPAR